ncbi:MAG: AMP-binding protein [Bacteroidetes bacterium]|nr:AMP-binding protein [Bacteroidota bacterium]MBS1739146.1 AMP-binding protein [Bacteroidota bacterium]
MGFLDIDMNWHNFEQLTLNGKTYSKLTLLDFCKQAPQQHINELGAFLSDWFLDADTITLKTSGSTGVPKTIVVRKEQMLKSAAATANYFNFKPGQSALLCLPMPYIAARMMVVRALFSGLNLICIAPCSNPLDAIDDSIHIDFAPLTPMQLHFVSNTKGIKHILLGGAPISESLELRCQSLSAQIFHGYGMTETLSHVAIRRVNGADKSNIFYGLPNMVFHTDERGCLTIDVPYLEKRIVTNDLVALLSDKSFIWQGRADNLINSGGIKLIPEHIEEKLLPFLTNRFFVAGLPDDKWGQKLVLVIEGSPLLAYQINVLKENMNQHLNRIEQPKEIWFIEKFIETPTGKIQRLQTLNLTIDERKIR